MLVVVVSEKQQVMSVMCELLPGAGDLLHSVYGEWLAGMIWKDFVKVGLLGASHPNRHCNLRETLQATWATAVIVEWLLIMW